MSRHAAETTLPGRLSSFLAGSCPFALVVPDLGVPLPDDRCELIYDLGDPSLFEFVETRQSVDFGLYQGRAIGEIHYRVLPIFNEDDPAENNWLYRAANFLHIETRETTLEKQMIVSPGDPWTGITSVRTSGSCAVMITWWMR